MKKHLLMMAALVCSFATSLYAQTFNKAFSFGGTNDDNITSVKTDANGNMYFAGFFDGTVDFDPGIIFLTVTSTGGQDGFLLKLDSAGAFEWVTTFDATGSNNVEPLAMDLDASNNIYLTGYFAGTMDFNGAGSQTLTSSGGTDIFVAKFDNLGDVLWAKKAGSTGVDIGRSISIGSNGNAYITGAFTGTVDFDPDGGSAVNITSNGLTDVFVWKLTPGGNITWVIGYGDTGTDGAFDIRVENGHVYTVGTFDGTVDFDPGAGINQFTSAGTSSDVFIQKLDAQGNYVYAKQIGSTSGEKCSSIEVDQDDNLYVAGSFQGMVDFDPNSGTSSVNSSGASDGFILKLDSVGDFKWAATIGGSGSDEVNRIALGEFNNIYAIGDFAGTIDLNTDAGIVQSTNANGGYDIFSIKLTNLGNFISGFAFGGGSSDNSSYITSDVYGNIYLSGSFGSTMDVSPWQPIAGSLLTSNGGTDAFVAQYKAFYVGLNETSISSSLEVYPNPAQNMFHIVPPVDFGTYTLAIYNAEGKLLIFKNGINNNQQTAIEHTLPAGIYTVKISGNSVITRKLAIHK